MKYVHDNYRGKRRTQTFWMPCLITLPVAWILLVTALPDFHRWMEQG